METSNTASLDPFVQAAARGDRDSFARLVTATSSLVSSIALAIVGEVETSRDVAQEVYLAAWRDLGRLRNPASFLPWLRQIARNQAHLALRGKVRRRRLISDGEADELLASAADPLPGAGEALLAVEEGRRLAEAIESLPDATREVVALYYREGRSARQVGELLGLSEEAVKQRLSRARGRLRESLLEELGDKLAVSRPGLAFTLAVMAAIASPPAASAAGAAGAASQAAGGSLVLKLASLVGGAALGALGGAAGILFGTRALLARARDNEERAGLRRFRAANLLLVALAAAAFPVADHLSPGPWPAVAVFVAFVATLALFQLVWLPRIVGRRLEKERLEDPDRWAAERRRGRRWAIVGWALGLLGGSAGLIAGLWMAAGH